VFTSAGAGLPSTTMDIDAVTSYGEALADGSWHFNLRSVDRSGNWDDGSVSTGPYRIDTVDPTTATNLASPTHTVNVLSCNTNVTVTWTGATDLASGLAGYVGSWTTSPITNPAGVINVLAGATSHAQDIGSSASARYFHLRAVDVAGNYGTTAHFGPIYASTNLVTIYCTAKTNSLGCTPAIGSIGQPSKSAGAFVVTASNVLNQRNGLLFWGTAQSSAPFQGGFKCVASPTVRTPLTSSGGSALPANDCSGQYAFTFTTAYMNSYGIAAGDTIDCQFWSRDPASVATSGLTNALEFTVCQ
jgi:hypothetical protein